MKASKNAPQEAGSVYDSDVESMTTVDNTLTIDISQADPNSTASNGTNKQPQKGPVKEAKQMMRNLHQTTQKLSSGPKKFLFSKKRGQFNTTHTYSARNGHFYHDDKVVDKVKNETSTRRQRDSIVLQDFDLTKPVEEIDTPRRRYFFNSLSIFLFVASLSLSLPLVSLCMYLTSPSSHRSHCTTGHAQTRQQITLLLFCITTMGLILEIEHECLSTLSTIYLQKKHTIRTLRTI